MRTPAAVVIVAAVIGLGNGIGSGIVMTLGSDASPAVGRTQFLSGWRMFGDTGNALGPMALSAITSLFSLAVATVSLGAFALVGATWLGYWIQHSAAGHVHELAAEQRLLDTETTTAEPAGNPPFPHQEA